MIKERNKNDINKVSNCSKKKVRVNANMRLVGFIFKVSGDHSKFEQEEFGGTKHLSGVSKTIKT